MITAKMVVQNMKTEQDMQKVDAVLHDVWGVRQVEADLTTKEVLISYNENAASFHDFEQAIIDCGYQIDHRAE